MSFLISIPFSTLLLMVVILVTITNNSNVNGAKQSSSTATKPSRLSSKCNDKKSVDKCMMKLIPIADPKNPMATDSVQMNKWCRDIKKSEDCVKIYSNECLDTYAKQSVSVLTYSISRTNKGYCNNKRRSKQFMKLGECINKYIKTYANMMKEVVKSYHSIQYYPNEKERVPMICCNYFQFKEEILGKIEELCDENAMKEAEHMMNGFSQDILNVLCTDYTDDSDKCQPILAKTPKWPDSKPLEYETFVIPLAQIVKSL